MSKWTSVKVYIQAYYDRLLQFLNIRISNEWLLLRAIHERYGDSEAKEVYANSILLGLEHGVRNNKSTVKAIREATENKGV